MSERLYEVQFSHKPIGAPHRSNALLYVVADDPMTILKHVYANYEEVEIHQLIGRTYTLRSSYAQFVDLRGVK